MRQYFCLHAVNHEGKTLMRWFIEHEDEQWKLTPDAGSMSPRLLQPFETAQGRYEMVALFLSPALFEIIRERLPEIFGSIEMPPAPARKARHNFRPLTASQRESFHLKLMNLKDEEIDVKKGHCKGATKQSLYRLRKDYRVRTTPGLIKRLEALGEL